MSAADVLVADQVAVEPTAAAMPPGSLTDSANSLNEFEKADGCSYRDPALSAADSAAALSARMSALAKRRRPPTPRRNLPAYLRTQIDGIESLRDNALLKRFDRELRAELKAAGLANVPEPLVDAAVRCRAVYELVEAVTFKETGGPVHRRQRKLHQYVEQRRTVLNEWLSMRQKLGLDQAPASASPPALEHLSEASPLDLTRRAQFTMSRMETALRNDVGAELTPGGSTRLMMLVSERSQLWQRWLAGDWKGVLAAIQQDPALSSQCDLIFRAGAIDAAPSLPAMRPPPVEVPRDPPMPPEPQPVQIDQANCGHYIPHVNHAEMGMRSNVIQVDTRRRTR